MRTSRGLTLVELVVFIVIVGIAFSALLAAFSTFTRSSPDPLIRKQALAIAESLLEEVELMPFTFCDPDDAHASTATASTISLADPLQCATLSEDTAIGPEAGESRGGVASPYDNVSDYNGYSTGPIVDVKGDAVTGLEGYTATITVSQAGLGGIAPADALLIKVTVQPPSGGGQVVLEGYRTRYAPRTQQ
jgi:MSHA pilin protein MshD